MLRCARFVNEPIIEYVDFEFIRRIVALSTFPCLTIKYILLFQYDIFPLDRLLSGIVPTLGGFFATTPNGTMW